MNKAIIAIFIAALAAIFYFSSPKPLLNSTYDKTEKIVKHADKSELGLTSKQAVAQYLKQNGKLPENFITKNEAKALGWDGGDLWEYAPQKSIGGDRFGNYEKKLPHKKGRIWRECDIDYHGGSRGAKRLVFSNDGLIFYTGDHYINFEKVE